MSCIPSKLILLIGNNGIHSVITQQSAIITTDAIIYLSWALHRPSSNCIWVELNLIGANLKGANLEKTNFRDVKLQNAKLENASLTKARFYGSKLIVVSHVTDKILKYISEIINKKISHITFFFKEWFFR